MLKQTLVVLTVEQAREGLVEHYTDFLLSNRNNTARLLREGKLDELPNLRTASANHVLALFRDNALGKTVADTEKVSLVAVQVDNNLVVVYTAPSAPVAPAPSDGVLVSSGS